MKSKIVLCCYNSAQAREREAEDVARGARSYLAERDSITRTSPKPSPSRR